MPVRSRSAFSSAAMCCFASRLMDRSSSSTGSTPSRMHPPSWAATGGSSTSVASTASRTSATSSSCAARLRSSGARQSPSRPRTRGMTATDCRSATRSRGPAVRSATRATSRSRSCTALSVSRSFDRPGPPPASSSTASSRSRIGSTTCAGRCNQARSSRPPMGVTVRSSSPSSDPARPPSADSRISRWRQVVASTSTWSARDRKTMRRTCTRSTFWVSWRYCTSAPAARAAAG